MTQKEMDDWQKRTELEHAALYRRMEMWRFLFWLAAAGIVLAQFV